MRNIRRAVLLVALVAIAPLAAGCSSGEFDADKLDIFGINEKKKLPGERKDLFPNGVPGVTQGIPPEYLPQNQQAATDAANAAPAAEPAPEEKPKPQAKPKPKPRTAAAPRPTRVNVNGSQPAQAAPAQQQQDDQQQQPVSQSPWPSTTQSAPAPGTFSR